MRKSAILIALMSLYLLVVGSVWAQTNMPQSVKAPAVVDTGNSTLTPLGVSGNFTGTAFDMTNYASWSVSVFADQNSATDGFKVQWSEDGSNWDYTDQTNYVASVGNMITFGPKARYVRLNYTNTSSGQSVFRVYAKAQPISVRETRKFVGQSLTDADTAQVIISALQGHSTAGGGTWIDVKVNPNGALVTDGSDVTQPVSGTVTANAGTGTFFDGIIKDGAGDTTQANVSSGNLHTSIQTALPAGTNNIGDVDVLTVPADPFGANTDAAATAGSTGSMQAKLRTMTQQLEDIKTAVQIIDNTVNTIGSTTSGSSGALSLCAATTSAPTYTTAQNHPISCQTDGSVRMYLTGSAVGGNSDNDDGSVADSQAGHTDVIALSHMHNGSAWVRVTGDATNGLDVDVTRIGGQTPAFGTGVRSSATQRVTIATDDVVPVSQSGSWSLAANQSVNVAQMNGAATTMGNGVSGTGVQRVTIASDSTGVVGATQSGTWTVQPGNTANTTAWLVSQTPATSGGLSISRLLSAASTNGTNAKASAGQVYGWYITNSNASARYVKLYNKASAPTCGTDTPVMTLLIPGASTGAGTNVAFPSGIAFGTGIGYCTTTGVADADTGAVAANEVILNLFYK